MDQTERTIISEMFDKLRHAESQNPQRDFQAETFIRERITFQPAAPYYMIQSLVVTEQALANMQARLEQAQHRIQQLEHELSQRPASGGGGLFGGLFGGKSSSPPTTPAIPSQQYGQPGYGQPGYGQPGYGQPHQQYGDPRVQQYMNPQHQQSSGGGFMAGALTTAAGVAGGMLIGNAVMGMFEDENPVADVADAAQGAVDDAQGQVEEASGGMFGGGSLFGGDSGGNDEEEV